MHPGSHGSEHGTTGAETRGQDLCLQIQVDLSAMLDGELDPAGVRRVTVHSDVCPGCRAFFDGIRQQVGVHNRLAAAMAAPVDGEEDTEAAQLRRKLTDNQRKLSRILYELGRNFALMGLSPDFSREVAQEPMPVPDVAMRGRNLLDEVARSDEGGADWVAAKELFDGQLRSAEENLAKGQRLLTECLALDPESEDARIYLGLVHYARGQRALARKQFQRVLSSSADVVMRGYALSNLSNILIDEGNCDGAIELLLQLVDSDVLRRQPRLTAALFNLALAYGLSGKFDESLRWFERLHVEAPHRRRKIGQELSRRSQFLHLVHTHPGAKALADALPSWFPAQGSGNRAAGAGLGSYRTA